MTNFTFYESPFLIFIQAEVLNQLTTMKTQLDKLEKSTDKQRRKSQVWGDIAEI